MFKNVVPAPNVEYVSGRQSIRACIPWIVPESIEHLEDLVKLDWRVFEWGCGGSVVWFAERCAKVVGVETTPRWIAWTRERLQERNLGNTNLIFAPTKQGDYTEYVNVIEAYPDAYFDLVSIDGVMSARKDSIERAKKKLKEDGLLLIDNSNMFPVKGLDDWYEVRYETEPHVFLGRTSVWATSLFCRKPI